MTYACSLPLSVETWALRAEKHRVLVAPWSDAFVHRRAIQKKHPVHDFLFTYYQCSPLKLKQWVPSFEESLLVTEQSLEKHPWLNAGWFHLKGSSLALDRGCVQENMRGLATFVANLCEGIGQRVPRFGCFGLHEWAMVYKLSPETVRHQGFRLRISHSDLASFVESQTLCCSHYDAYRFFTQEAKPLNLLNPQLETRLQMEQGGCVHANMDLYKWSAKLWPWIGSDFIAKTFLLAVEGRELDMRASPYDLTDEGYESLCIETEEGRRQYQKEQQLLAEKAIPLRQELQDFCKRFSVFNEK